MIGYLPDHLDHSRPLDNLYIKALIEETHLRANLIIFACLGVYASVFLSVFISWNTQTNSISIYSSLHSFEYNLIRIISLK